MPSLMPFFEPCGEMTAVSYSVGAECIPFPTNRTSVYQPTSPENYPDVRSVPLPVCIFSSHPCLSYSSDVQAALVAAFSEPYWLPEMVFGYTDEKLDQRASCFCEQRHFWGRLLHWGDLDFSRDLKLHQKHIC